MTRAYPILKSEASFSPCRQYRYTLTRVWRSEPCVMFIGLNPSTADETVNDPTVRRCMGFAASWGFGGMVMTNLFAFRSTNPEELKNTDDPVGPENNLRLREEAMKAPLIVACWGGHGQYLDRAREIAVLLAPNVVHCLGLTRRGEPKHPLYLPSNTKPVFWDGNLHGGFGEAHP